MIKNIFKNQPKLRKIIKKSIYLFFSFSYFFKKPQPTVLMYHSIAEGNHYLSVSPETLDKQMKYLTDKGYVFLKTKDLFNIEKFYNQKAVLLTFDDGFEDNFYNALPILKKYKVPAIFFISSGLAGSEFIRKEFTCMTWDQVNEIASDDLFEVGSHAVTHQKLTYLNKEEVESEIAGSKKIIEEKINKKIISFASPFGRYNGDTLESLEKNDYKFAFTTYPDSLANKFSLLEIPRLMIDDIVNSKFSGVFTGGYALYLRFTRKLFSNK